jgi:hypothetical protein
MPAAMRLLLPVTLLPKSPLALQVAQLVGHGLAAATLWTTELHLGFQLAGSLLLSASALATVIRLRRNRLRTLTLRDAGSVEVEFLDGRHGDAKVQPGSTVLASLVLLRLEMGGRRLVLPLASDMLNAADFRLLRVWMRWRSVAEDEVTGYS